MIYGSVCSGIEAATVAWHPLGWKAAFYSEIEKFPRAVLAHHYPDVPLHGDFTTIGENDYGSIDLLCGGTPCQSFSVAGLRKGLTDDRGNLALEFIRLAQRKKPRWLVWENVPGVLSSNGGRDFGAFLGGLVECGYGIAYRVLDAQYFGVPQRRRRVIVIGYLGDWRPAAAVLFESESLRGDITPRRKARSSVAALTANGVGTCGADDNQGQAGHLIPDTASSLTSGGSGQRGRQMSSEMAAGGHLIPFDMTALGEYGDGKTASTVKARDYKDATDLVTHALPARYDSSEDGCGRGTPLVPIAFDCKASGRNGFGVGEIASTLRSMGHAGSHQNGGGHEAVAYGIQANTINRAPKNGGNGLGFSEEQSPTLTKADQHAVASFKIGQGAKAGGIGYDENVAPTLSAADSGTNRTPGLMQDMAVRRLTPRECERLQGFPDDYTLIPVRERKYKSGETLSDNGEFVETGKMVMSADGPRYKALGNSWAVPKFRWIGERIQMIDDMIKAGAE